MIFCRSWLNHLQASFRMKRMRPSASINVVDVTGETHHEILEVIGDDAALALSIGSGAQPASAQYVCDLNGLQLFVPYPGLKMALPGESSKAEDPVSTIE